MDDLTEREQLERIRLWWRENGWYVIGGIGLGLALLFGWQQWNQYQERRAVEAATLYQDFRAAAERDAVDEADTLLATLRDRHDGSPYADQAGLMMGRLLFRLGQSDRAADELRQVMQASRDRELSLVARLRLARILAYQGNHREALTLARVSEPGQLAARFSELRGDLHAALGELDAARGAYLQALVEPGSDLIDRTLLQLKLNDLPGPAENGS